MKHAHRATAVLLLVIAAAGCTDHGSPKATPSHAVTAKSASPSLPPFPSEVPGDALLQVTGRGSGRHQTRAFPAGTVTAEVSCAGAGDLSVDFNDRKGKAIYKVLSQPCATTGIQKITFGSPAEPQGLTVKVAARGDTQYALLLTR